jgi:extracellular elastinolytic metalloproteinase
MRLSRVMPRSRWARRATFPAALALMALMLTPSSFGIVNIEGVTNDQLPDFDARVDAAPSAAQLQAAAGIHGRVTWNSLGTPGQITRRGGYLSTHLKAPSATSAARAWIAAHKRAFRLGSVSHLRVMTAEAMPGTHHRDYTVVFRQMFAGVPSSDGVLAVSVVRKGHGWNVVYVSSSLAPDARRLTGKRILTPVAAWLRAAHAAGYRISRSSAAPLGRTPDGSVGISAAGFTGTETVQPIAFGTPRRGALRAYSATVTKTVYGPQSSYQVIIDAATGKLLYRQNQVFNAIDNPTWKGFQLSPPYNPLNAYPWNYPSTDTRETFCWTATAGCTNVIGDATTVYGGGVASKFPWDAQLDAAGANLGTTATVGNNVDDARVWSGGHGVYGNATLVRDTSATRDYQPAWTNAWYTSGCNPDNVNASINPLGNDIEASTASMFVGHNRMHDFSYYLGFDEGHWNAQQYNNGVTTVDPTPPPGGPVRAPAGNDGLIGNAQSGAASGSRDNANMSTGADGSHPTTNQFVWQPLAASFYAPCVDGAYDFTVYGHEYGHLIENRLIGKGVGARQGNAAGAMGEAFGDFDALEVVNELHLPIPAGADRYTEGAYATGNGYNGIRDFLAGRPMGGQFPQPGQNPDTDPLNYGDFGFDNVGPEVHADGEIWIALQIDLRDLFLERYPSSGAAEDIACVRGQQDTNTCPGDRRWIQLYYDSMVLMPRNPTMIQARDAMLAADMARFGGANQDLLWQGFALRGFGQYQNTVSNADTDPTPDFSSPLANNATLNFFADNKGNTLVPVNAKIYVGDYQARSTQIADTDPSTNPSATPGSNNLDNTAQFVPTAGNPRWSSYNFTAVAPGFGMVRFNVRDLQPGETRDLTIHFAPNHASSSQGATVAGDALGTNTNLSNVLDDDEGTNDGQTGASAVGRWFVIALGDINPNGNLIKRLGVSTLLVPGNNRFTALRSFDAYACRANKNAGNPTCDGSIDAGWTKIVSSPGDAFPAVNPRPVTPDMTLRYFDASPQVVATHIKFVVANNQCTGQASYQGDQDNDPNNNADCSATTRANEVHITEVEVFGQNPTVDGTKVKTG